MHAYAKMNVKIPRKMPFGLSIINFIFFNLTTAFFNMPLEIKQKKKNSYHHSIYSIFTAQIQLQELTKAITVYYD